MTYAEHSSSVDGDFEPGTWVPTPFQNRANLCVAHKSRLDQSGP